MSTVREERFLAQWLPRLQRDQNLVIPPGDDCAGILQPDGSLLLIAADQVAMDHHYAVTDDPQLVGRKLLARNLSDVAAMGGSPTYAIVTLAFPRSTAAERADALMTGITDLARDHGVIVAGGDVGAAGAEVATVTILGTVAAGKVVRRRGAEPGDQLFVTGRLGGSLGSGRHLSFMPRLVEGRFLAERGFAKAMLDLSDGLVVDLGRMCEAGGVAASLWRQQLPLHPGGTVDAACYDGEDYELLFAVAAGRADELVASWPFATPLTAIGEVTAIGAAPGQTMPLAGSFDHFGANTANSRVWIDSPDSSG